MEPPEQNRAKRKQETKRGGVMLQYLIVLLDDSASSFCFYPTPQCPPRLISLDVLKKVISFAQKRNLIINFLQGETELPQSHLDVIDEISHLFMINSRFQARTLDDILVVDSVKNEPLPVVHNRENLILRISRECLDSLAGTVMHFAGDTQRINVHLLDMDLYNQVDFDTYREQLAVLSDTYGKTSGKELNILTDRIMLSEMNNCGAGITHITVAPNGKLYVCPAFYYDDAENSIGSIDDEIRIKNRQLYEIGYAPICRKCDAYQCKRCVWLNQKTTGEVNTPSREQCVVSHLERNAGRSLLLRLSGNSEQIPEINYLDPFEQ